MATKMTVIYECKKCGTEVTVNSAGFRSVDPIYCCGKPLLKIDQVKNRVVSKKNNTAPSGQKSAAEKTGKLPKKAVDKVVKKKKSSQ